MSRLPGWRPSFRIAWRDARRSRARSVLVLVMIALPVLGVTAADVVIQTNEVSGDEALERRLGAADARVTVQDDVRVVVQGFDPDDQSAAHGGGRSVPPRDLDDVRDVLGDGARGILWQQAAARVVTDAGVAEAEAATLDLADPLASGIFEVDSGRAPAAGDEVVVNTALAERGFGVGDVLEVEGRGTYAVVGIGESTSDRDHPGLVGPSPDLTAPAIEGSTTWLVDAGPVSWEQVQALNAIGASVLSRAVMLDPPPDSALPAEIRSWGGSSDDDLVAVAALVVVMALIEVVLLAGPAFAVGARRQARTLALLAASGGTPRQARRVVLASGLVLGGLGAGLGVLLGLLAAAAALPVLQRFSGSWFGPYDVPWLHLAGIAGFGLLSAFLAALVPAWIASRQDVVAVLAGRRGDRPPGARSPVLGVVLLAVGAAGSAYGAVGSGSGEILIAASAIPAVLGMVLVVPVVLGLLGGVSRCLPLPLRYAVRDAARHRTRTVPAVAAVAATVAGVVALGVANASDAAQNEATYRPALARDHASVTAWQQGQAIWPRLRAVVDGELGKGAAAELRGVPEDTAGGGFLEVSFRVEGEPVPLDEYGSAVGSSVLVSDRATRDVLPQLDAAELARAQAALDAGGAVVYSADRLADQEVEIRVRPHGPRNGLSGDRLRATVPAAFVRPVGWSAPGQAVLSEAAARTLGAPTKTVSLLITEPLTDGQEADLQEALTAVSADVGLYVERGHQADDETVILLLVLGALGGLLMLGGTLTATFLALSDARPDLATLSAVGASPRSRRGVAASYALVVGVVGALLGAAVGFIPGVAVTYPLTGEVWTDTGPAASHYLDVPWLLVGTLVLALPLLTAAVVGLTVRSRLPMVARLD